MPNPVEFSQEMRSRKLWFGIFIFGTSAALLFVGKLTDAIFGNIAEACIYAYALANVGAAAVKAKYKNNSEGS